MPEIETTKFGASYEEVALLEDKELAEDIRSSLLLVTVLEILE